MGNFVEENDVQYSLSYEDKFTIEDIEERHLHIYSQINELTVSEIVYHILRFNREDKGIPAQDRKPIIIYINSPGGSLCSGFGVIDAIRSSITPVYTVNQALCASMAFLIFIAGHKRYSMERSEFLLHEGATGGYVDSVSKMRERIEFETIQLEQMAKEYVLDRTSIDSDVYDHKYRSEWYFLPDEAKSIGVVDYIVGKDCSIDEIC